MCPACVIFIETVWRSICTTSLTVQEEDKQFIYERNTEAPLRNYCFRGKTVGITNSESVSVALVVQHVKLMRRTIS